MLATARNFNPIVEVFDPYSVPFTNQQESNRGNDQQTNYKCSSAAVLCKTCSACTACSACA
jgi:hypothetical protein